MKRVILEAPKGMLYTDGSVYGSKIHLAEGMDGREFRLITKEEYSSILDAEAKTEVDENM